MEPSPESRSDKNFLTPLYNRGGLLHQPRGWRAWLNNTTLSLGVDSVFDLEPPFVAAAVVAAGAAENSFDEATANAKGRFWYIGVKKRF